MKPHFDVTPPIKGIEVRSIYRYSHPLKGIQVSFLIDLFILIFRGWDLLLYVSGVLNIQAERFFARIVLLLMDSSHY